jgi:HSP20 family molecular chaperone IbpA
MKIKANILYNNTYQKLKDRPMLKSIMELPIEDQIKMFKVLEMASESINKIQGSEAYKQGKIGFDTIVAEADRIFEEVFGSDSDKTKQESTPKPVFETEDKPKGFSNKTGIIEVPLAGYAKEDMSIWMDGEILIIKNTNKTKKEKIVKYRIPGEIKNLVCSMENGLLVVRVIRPTEKPVAQVQWN